MSNQNHSRFFGGRGYYIALILCACAIGISGYVFYSGSAGQPDTPVLATEDAPVRAAVVSPTRPPEPSGPAAEQTAPTEAKRVVCMPVEGEILSPYAVECLAYNETTRDWRTHTGIDIGAEAGTEVRAAADGQVYTVYSDEQMGTTVVIRHAGGYVTKYASLAADTLVAPGEQVRAGQPLGSVGRTALMESSLGDHVHFCVTKNDVPVDPEAFLAG